MWNILCGDILICTPQNGDDVKTHLVSNVECVHTRVHLRVILSRINLNGHSYTFFTSI